MLKIQQEQLKAIPLTLGIALLSVTAAPASAQSVLERGMTSSPNLPYNYSGGVVVQPVYPNPVSQPQAAPFVYGSPIPAPVPVNPATGQIPSNTTNTSNNYYSYPDPYYSGRGRVDNSTLINPTLVNPRINDSTLVNPVIINDSGYQVPLRRERSLIFVGPH